MNHGNLGESNSDFGGSHKSEVEERIGTGFSLKYYIFVYIIDID